MNIQNYIKELKNLSKRQLQKRTREIIQKFFNITNPNILNHTYNNVTKLINNKVAIKFSPAPYSPYPLTKEDILKWIKDKPIKENLYGEETWLKLEYATLYVTQFKKYRPYNTKEFYYICMILD